VEAANIDQYIAQLNIARSRYPFDDPRMAGFLALIEHVYAAADSASGFIWRLKDESGKMNSVRDPQEIINLSVWRTAEELRAYVVNGIHGRAFRRRQIWFETLSGPYAVFWRIEPDHLPTIEEGLARLELLQRCGVTEEAFGWDQL
jgi:hypothetical protein